MSKVVVRARKFMTNKLLQRKQFVVDVTHPETANVSKVELRKILAKKYRCKENCVVLFGFRTQFGGMKSTGFCLIYNTFDLLRKFEPRHRQVEMKIAGAEKTGLKRKDKKVAKTKMKKMRFHQRKTKRNRDG